MAGHRNADAPDTDTQTNPNRWYYNKLSTWQNSILHLLLTLIAIRYAAGALCSFTYIRYTMSSLTTWCSAHTIHSRTLVLSHTGCNTIDEKTLLVFCLIFSLWNLAALFHLCLSSIAIVMLTDLRKLLSDPFVSNPWTCIWFTIYLHRLSVLFVSTKEPSMFSKFLIPWINLVTIS